MAEINLGTLYEFNQSAMNNEKPLDPILLNEKIKEVVKDMRTNKNNNVRFYWMLLNNSRKDYTVFHIKEPNTYNLFIVKQLEKDLKETLQNRGQVLSIDQQEDGNYEIWIRDLETQENIVYYLFDYTIAVIEA